MTKGAPAGVRAASALLWAAAGCGAWLSVTGFLADRRAVNRLPSLLPLTAYPGQDPADLVHTVLSALWLQIVFGGIAAIGCAVGAEWIRRPTGNARVVGFALPIVFIPVIGLLLGGSAAGEIRQLVE